VQNPDCPLTLLSSGRAGRRGSATVQPPRSGGRRKVWNRRNSEGRDLRNQTSARRPTADLRPATLSFRCCPIPVIPQSQLWCLAA
jgi:hypothetical protein